jgi:predicted enzyme related to lactoylglutathione lyase
MQVVGYCRTDQADVNAGRELTRQREEIASHVASCGWELLAVYEDGCAGDDLPGREGLAGALAAVDSRTADALVVTDLTRLGTRLEDVARLVHSSRKRHWTLVSLAERISTAEPTAEPLLSLVSTFMPVIAYVTFDCQQPDSLADFWAAATRCRKAASPDPAQYSIVRDLAGRNPTLWFNKVPEPKAVKNRVHLCLNVQSVEHEIVRLVRLGATRLAEHSSSSGKRWVVMCDPEGNEFCLCSVSGI